MRHRFRAAFQSASGARGTGLLLAVSLLAWIPGEAGGQTTLPAGWDGGLFEIRVPGITSKTLLVVLNPLGDVLLPVSDVLDMTETVTEEVPGGAISLRAAHKPEPGLLFLGRSYLLTPEGDSLSIPAEKMRLDAGQLFLAQDLVEAWLGAELLVEWDRLRITLKRDPPFPVEARLGRESARNRLLRPLAFLEPPISTLDAPFPASSGLGLLSWAVSSNAVDPREHSTLNLRMGGALLGGDITVGGAGTAGNTVKERFEYGTATYRRSFPKGTLVRELFAGDVTTRGSLGRSVRGLLLTNRPRTLGSVFDHITINPDIPGDWEYEVYRDGHLIGYSDPTNPGSVDVPMGWGRNTLEIRMYGPTGEEVVTSTLFQIPLTQLPKGRLEYSAGGGRCVSTASCRAMGYLDLDYGLARGLTVGVGTEALRDSLGGLSILPSASLSLIPASGWVAQAQAVSQTLLNASLVYSGKGNIRGSVQGTYYSLDEGQIGRGIPGQGRWRILGNLSLPLARFYLSSSGPRGGGPELWTGSIGRLFPFGFLQGFYESDALGRGERVGARLTSGATDRLLRGSTANGAIRFHKGRLDQLRAGLSAAVQPGTYVSAGIGWRRGSRPTLSLTFSRRMGFGRLQSLVRTREDGSTHSSYALSGTLAYDHAGISAIPEYTVGLAGIRGTVFYDRNGNGVFDGEEEPAPDVHVKASNRTAVTDERGEYRVWGVVPYEPIAVQLDTVRTFIPDWAPAKRRVVLRAVPNLYREIDIPLLPTKELIGSVTADADIATVGGLTLELTHEATGETQNHMTFSDGTFYVQRLRSGRYRIQPAESSLRALGARAVPEVLEFEVRGGEGDPFLELPAIHLERVSAPNWQTGGRVWSSTDQEPAKQTHPVDRLARDLLAPQQAEESGDGSSPAPDEVDLPMGDLPDGEVRGGVDGIEVQRETTDPSPGLPSSAEAPSSPPEAQPPSEAPEAPETDSATEPASGAVEPAQRPDPAPEAPETAPVSPQRAPRGEPEKTRIGLNEVPEAAQSPSPEELQTDPSWPIYHAPGVDFRMEPEGFVTTPLQGDPEGIPPLPGNPDSRRDPAPVQPPLAVQRSPGLRTRNLVRGHSPGLGRPRGPPSLTGPARRLPAMSVRRARVSLGVRMRE